MTEMAVKTGARGCLKKADALFPITNPGIVSIPLSFATLVVVSLLTSNPRVADRAAAEGRR